MVQVVLGQRVTHFGLGSILEGRRGRKEKCVKVDRFKECRKLGQLVESKMEYKVDEDGGAKNFPWT